MQSQARRDWNTFRFGFFWFGVVISAITGIFFVVLVLRSDSENLPFWYMFNLACGPLISYLVAWIGSAHLSVRVLAVFLYVISGLATLSPGLMLIESPGLLALVVGVPDRPSRSPANCTLLSDSTTK